MIPKSLDDIEIAIPSRSRFGRSLALEALGPLTERVKLYVPVDQWEQYETLADRFGCEIIPVPSTKNGIWKTRQWVLDTTDKPRVLFLDDDLQFYFRTKPMGNLLYVQKPETPAMVDYFSEVMDDWKVPFVGVGLRQYSHAKKEFVLPHTSACSAYLLDVKVLADAGFRLDQFVIQGDFALILMLLTNGYNTVTVYRYVQGQRSSNQEGGCSDYRTPQVMVDSAHKLAEMFPDFVTPVIKTTKWKGEIGDSRTDVRISWKKAWEYGQRKNRKGSKRLSRLEG